MKRGSRLIFLAAVLVFIALPAYPHLAQLVVPRNGGAPQPSLWVQSAFPIVWQLNPSRGANITGGRSLADVIQASFNTWTGAPNTALSVNRGGDTSTNTAAADGTNLVCFVCSGDFSKDAETLAVTTTTTADAAGEDNLHGGKSTTAGQILDADILFNPASHFATDGSGTGQDLQTVATHEIGHFFGLDHSGVVRAVMFPFAPPFETTLSYDDVAGISGLYPKGSPDVPTSTVSGNVTLNGAGVFGAHVYVDSETANQPFGGSIRKSPIGTLSLPDGSYTITGVPPDTYTVIAEPLDGPASNSDVSGYAPAFGQSAVETDFTTRWH